MLVTFDFDSTLTKPIKKSFAGRNVEFWDSSTQPNENLLEKLQALSSEGHEIRVVTTRDSTSGEEVFDFIDKHSLPICDVHFTCGEDKLPLLEEIESNLHFDDSLEELERIAESKKVTGRLVPHPHDKNRHSDRIKRFKTV